MTNSVFAPPALGTNLALTGLPGGSSKIHDRSPYGNHGTIIGATWKMLPSGLWVLSFDGGDDSIDISAIQPMPPQGTVEIWVYMANWADGVLRNLFDTSQAGGDHRILLRKQADNTPNFYMATTTTQVNIIGSALSGSGWKHWVVRYKANGCSLYIDNTLIGIDASCVMPSFIAGQGTRLGSAFDASGAFWNGLIALPYIRNRLLSALELQNSFNREKRLFGVW